jgi:[protein-PII] uridylyltransferase
MINNVARLDKDLMHDSSCSTGTTHAHDELRSSKEAIEYRFSSGEIKEDFHGIYTEILDQYFRSVIQESITGQNLFKKEIPFSLVAVGGYGRRELCLYSDIDIFILFNKKISIDAKTLTEEMFYPLWDLGLELGYGVRNINDCLTLANNDFQVLTSLLDARFLCGDSLLYFNLVENLHKKVVRKNFAALSNWIEDIDKARINTYGVASHLLEPNLKEGIGGLRDYHHILWTAKCFNHIRDFKDLEHIGKLSNREYLELEKMVRFILFVRSQLHQISGRKNDRLNFEYQEEIARRLGYKNMNKIPAVEQFLGKLHSYMEAIKSLNRSFLLSHAHKGRKAKNDLRPTAISKGLHIFDDEIGFDSIRNIVSEPYILIDILEKSSSSGCPLSLDAKRLIKEYLYLVDNQYRSSEKVVQSFLNIINSQNAIMTLDQMVETGFLDAFIPEFAEIRDRVQFDAYHIFPVGRHSLQTVAYLKNISKGKDVLLVDLFAELEDRESLLLAGLFHDIGKNGKGHARRGVRIAKNILERFGYPSKPTEEILFLIENHLLLTETATRRDLNDEKIIIQCARKIGSINRLKALYLLTWADSNATGPRAWNEWIADLVKEIFFKILHILEMGELATPGSSQKIIKVKKQLRHLTHNHIGKGEFKRLFDVMSTRYKLNTDVKDIVHHLEMLERLKEETENNQSNPFILDIRDNKQRNSWEVTFLGKDRPGLFSDITGVMALNNINILSSNIYTWADGTAVDIFSVTSPLDSINPDETWKKIKMDLKNTFSGKLALPYRLSQKAIPSIISNRGKPYLPPEVVIDNKSSDFFTLIEIFASDRIGLLYLITRTLFDLRLDIRIAKTGVKGDQIADVFYVRDLEDQKVEDEEQVKEIKRALIHQLNPLDLERKLK